MRFSFITCTYNRADALDRTMESLCAQDFDEELYEIVIIDNNSSDNTFSIIDKYKVLYETKIIRSFKELNQGLSFALNRGIKEATGEFLVYIDDDETVNRDHLTKLDEYLITYPDVVLAGSGVVPIYEGDEPKWMSRFTQRLIGGYFNAGDSVVKLHKSNYPGTGHTIIKRNLYDTYGLYNTELGRTGKSLIGAEDKDMFYRLQKNGVECYYFPNIPVYHYINKEKLTDRFFRNLTYSIGKSERIRTLGISKSAYCKKLLSESFKWGASGLLFLFYAILLTPQKGIKLLQFRWNVTRGLLAK